MLVKHSDRTVRKPCRVCKSTDLYWAHDTERPTGRVCDSSGIPAKAIKARGQVISALAFALTRLGFSCEMWVDVTTTKAHNNGRYAGSVRVMVKGSNDILDPARVLFAYAHPAMLRRVCFAAAPDLPNYTEHGHESVWNRSPEQPRQDLPEGTIYLPELMYGSREAEDPVESLRGLLRQVGVL
jgi:hypothetical protein